MSYLRLFVLLALLSACAAPPAVPTSLPSATPTARSTPTAPPTKATLPTPTQAPPAASATPLPQRPMLVWAVAPEAQREPLAKLLAAQGQAAGVPLTVVVKSADALAADLAAGSLAGLDAPDLYWGGADDLFLLQRTGAILPAKDGIVDADMLPATIEGSTAAGTRWGTPVAARGFLLLLYNQKLVERVPTTADDLLAEARRLNGGGNVGLVAAWVEMRWLQAWLAGWGERILAVDGSPQLDTPAMIEALGLLKSLRAAGPPPPSTYAAGAKLFRDGKAAFAIDGDWALSEYRRYTETLELGFAPLPTVSPAGQRALAPLEGIYLMYGAQLNEAQRGEAHKLAEALLRPGTQAALARELGYLPALRSAIRDSAVTRDPALRAAAQTAERAPGLPPSPGLRCAWESAEGILPLFLLGDLDAEETSARLQRDAETCMARSQFMTSSAPAQADRGKTAQARPAQSGGRSPARPSQGQGRSPSARAYTSGGP
jgi:arabinogalactan oligomer/maltooligosaccharide transport system substrate-binding protein